MLFTDIIGHSNIKERLIGTVKEERISHAQLFLGKEGSGNLQLAIAYAQYISCQNKKERDSCGECFSCLKFEKLIHPDLHFTFPVATNSIIKDKPVSSKYLGYWREALLEDPYLSLASWQERLDTGNKQLLISKYESEAILKILNLKTYESEYKFMIIWHPEKFNIASANKLLKIIEEPPSKTLFVLVAQDQDKIIPTILSRTQLVKIGPVSREVLKEELMSRYSIDESTADDYACQAQGNLIQMRKIIDQSDQEKLFFSLFTEWMRAAFRADVIALIEWVEGIANSAFGREKQKQFLEFGLRLIRESLILNVGNDDLKRSTRNEQEFISKFAPFIHGANCIEIISLFNEASYHIERNVNPKIMFLDVSLKLTKLLRVKNHSEA